MSSWNEIGESKSQVVIVVSDCRLVDAAGNEFMYWRRDGCGLAPGIYVAIPKPGARRRFGEDTEFRGVYASEADAQAAADAADARTTSRGERRMFMAQSQIAGQPASSQAGINRKESPRAAR